MWPKNCGGGRSLAEISGREMVEENLNKSFLNLFSNMRAEKIEKLEKEWGRRNLMSWTLNMSFGGSVKWQNFLLRQNFFPEAETVRNFRCVRLETYVAIWQQCQCLRVFHHAVMTRDLVTHTTCHVNHESRERITVALKWLSFPNQWLELNNRIKRSGL